MPNYNFDEVINRRNTNCGKWDTMDEKYKRDDLIHLGVADMDFKAPPEILQALEKTVAHGIFGYTDLSETFYTSIIEWIKKQQALTIDKDWIVFCPRINIASSLIIEALTQPTDKVMINTPAYTPLRNAILKQGRTVLDSPLKQEGDKWQLDFEHMASLVDADTKLFILCSPHNPTCRVWNQEELEKLETFCIKHDLILFSDEIHSDLLAPETTFTSTLKLSKALQNRLIYANSPTKTFNIPGSIISYMVIPNKELRNKVTASIDRIGMHNPNCFALSAFEAGYTLCDQWLIAINKYIYENELLFRNYLNTFMPKFHIYPREGTYLLWVDYTALNITEETLEHWFLDCAKVSVYMGSAFSGTSSSCIRINLATSRITLTKALERMKQAYPELLN